jgi:hypothetical protein
MLCARRLIRALCFYFFVMDKLLEIIDTGEFEDTGIIRLIFVKEQGERLKLIFKVTPNVGEVHLQRWVVRCDNVIAHQIILGNAYDLALESDHVLLWEHQKPRVAISFFTESVDNPLSVVGQLYRTHMDLVGECIPFNRYFNMPEKLDELIAGRYGLLSEGPEPLMQAYEMVLKENGFQTTNRIVVPNAHEGLSVLMFGDSYIVASGFDAALESKGET